MKKLLLAVAAVMLAIPLQVRADEGMWLLQLLEKMNYKDMKKAGCKLTPKQIYDINNSSLKDAIVQFGGGCTAEVVSDRGLVFTNHHCGYGSIQKLSGIGHDYLRDGYWAMNEAEELPAEGLTVTFIERFDDVTDVIAEATGKSQSMNAEEASAYMRKVVDSVEQAAVNGNKYLRARVSGFYNDNVYYVIVTKTFRDIRFVGAPPSSIGKFGGETDNWEWPRHTGDFSVFRIYADKDNNPAPYSKDNVPYTPKKSLAISLKGYKPGDFTMIIGFPGRTNRYLTSAEVIDIRDADNTPRAIARTAKENVWKKAMRADEKTNIQYASKFAGSSNFRKKSIAMNDAFKNLGIVEKRAETEKAFQEWAEQTPERKAKYGDALSTINEIVSNRLETKKSLNYLIETLFKVELIDPMGNLYFLLGNGGAREEKIKRYLGNLDAIYKDYSPELDRETSKVLLKVYRENMKDLLPDFYNTVDSLYGGDSDAFVDYIFDNSAFTKKETLAAALKDTSFNVTNDPVFKYWESLSAVYEKLAGKLNKDAGRLRKAKSLYMEGIMEMNGGAAMYPDANSTMRLTYGKIGGYSPKDGVTYNYYTTLDGVMQKEDPENPEFVVPEKLKELWRAKDYGRYANEKGELPLCFLSDNDITGGNSGSDVLNAKGELIGLAFDGNYESMSSDILFDTKLQRCISVDIRYVLFVIDKVGGAGYLLDELKIK